MIKRVLILLFSVLFFICCRASRRIAKYFNKVPATCVVVYYHGVSSTQRTRFAKQMDILLKWSIPISADFVSPLEHGKQYTIVTFDDGFTDTFFNAVPELQERQIPATLFIPTGYIGEKAGWLCRREGVDVPAVVGWDQLKNLDTKIISVGSHCVTHRRLPLLDNNEARKEIYESRKLLEKVLGQSVELLSFPHGEYNASHVDLAKQAGYKRVFSITPTKAQVSGEEYITGRVPADPQDWRIEFLLKILGAYRWLPIVYNAKKKMRRIVNRGSDKRERIII